jgi:hypothetical protein
MERKTEPMQPKYHDIVLNCADCRQDWVFTAGDQQFFYSKGLATPKRCQPCRKARKESIAREGGW